MTKLGISGISRGGMMTYLALKKTCQFKAAVVLSGAANAISILKSRPEFDGLYSELIPNYKKNKNKELTDRSATFWADSMCKTTPLLIMQGSSDWRVPADEAIELVQKLYKYKHPTRFILFEGADHGIREFEPEVFSETKRHFDYYLRDAKKWPSMKSHGR